MISVPDWRMENADWKLKIKFHYLIEIYVVSAIEKDFLYYKTLPFHCDGFNKYISILWILSNSNYYIICEHRVRMIYGRHTLCKYFIRVKCFNIDRNGQYRHTKQPWEYSVFLRIILFCFCKFITWNRGWIMDKTQRHNLKAHRLTSPQQTCFKYRNRLK